ncbi:hypothetical protein [Bordetella petrii]|uniref:hypothetical protein n=1 Tax=Bordetella petrii TaxID=94624 RepID=UPI0012485B70|nr:hypothetical protein [Bordetella petrii]
MKNQAQGSILSLSEYIRKYILIIFIYIKAHPFTPLFPWGMPEMPGEPPAGTGLAAPTRTGGMALPDPARSPLCR